VLQSNPDLVHELYDADPAANALGSTIEVAEAAHVRLRMPVTDVMGNGHGIVHGGYARTSRSVETRQVAPVRVEVGDAVAHIVIASPPVNCLSRPVRRLEAQLVALRALPRNAVGKISRPALGQLYWPGPLDVDRNINGA
jgi:hypothetical protein